MPASVFVAATRRSESTLRNWLGNPPKQSRAAFGESTKLLSALRDADPDFQLPVSGEASQQILRMRINIERGDFDVNDSSFMRVYSMDMETLPDVERKARSDFDGDPFDERDWDAALCCYYYRLNRALYGIVQHRAAGPYPQELEETVDLVRRMAEARLRDAATQRIEASMRLICISALNNNIHVRWEATSSECRGSEGIASWIRKTGFFEETRDFRNCMPDFFLPVFSALALASRLGDENRFDALWTMLRVAESGFTKEWFEAAYHDERDQQGWVPPAGLAPKFAAAVDSDFSSFIRWLNEPKAR